MQDELNELLDTAIYKEFASQVLYTTGQNLTTNPAAKTLLKELAEQEYKHFEWLKKLKDKGIEHSHWHTDRLADLKISDYISGKDSLDNASLQDVLVFAMKREQQSLEFYSRMTGAVSNKAVRDLCERLVHEELKHKLKLETIYDELFYTEN